MYWMCFKWSMAIAAVSGADFECLTIIACARWVICNEFIFHFLQFVCLCVSVDCSVY